MNTLPRLLAVMAATLVLLAVPVTKALAGTATYYVNQSNVESVLPDGTDYLKVVIDSTTAGTATFDITPVFSFSLGTNFGLQAFGFNYGGSNAIGSGNFSDLAPGWTIDLPPPSGMDGFGKYDFIVQTTGSNRQSPLVFTVTGLGGATTADTLGYFAKMSSGNAGQGNQFFAARLAGFATSDANITSGYFAGSSVAPVPESGSYALMLAGLFLLIPITRQRKQNQTAADI